MKEESLYQEELNILLENMSEMICGTTLDGAIKFVSRSFEKQTGYKAHEISGSPLADLFHTSEKEFFIGALSHCIKLSVSIKCYLQLRCRNEEYLKVNVILNPSFDKSGKLSGVAACMQNIANYYNHDALTVNNKSKYQNLFENMASGFAHFKVLTDKDNNPVDFMLLECNTTFKMITITEDENIVGKLASDIIVIKDNVYVNLFSKVQRVAVTGESVSFEFNDRTTKKYFSCYAYRPYEGCITMFVKDISADKKKDELDKIVAYISAKFNKIPTKLIDQEITNTLHKIVRYFNAECGQIYLKYKNEDTFSKTHEWQKHSIAKSKGNSIFSSEDFNWLASQLSMSNMIQVVKVDDIPKEAVQEAVYFKSMGYKSLICLPITIENNIIGVFTLITFNYETEWELQHVELLKIICTVLSGAIKRKESEALIKYEINKLVNLKEILQDSEEKFRKLIQSIRDAIILVDNEDRIVNWNKGAERIFGFSFEEVLGLKLHQVILPPESRESFLNIFEKIKGSRTGKLTDRITELNTIRKGGSTFHAEISLSFIKIKGKNHAVGIVRDITERKQAQKVIMEAMEAAEAANRAKSMFLANMSHEIRTPLNGIMGFMELLGRTSLDSQQRDFVQEMKNASDSLLSLINDLLDFSKIEANKIELENISFKLTEVVEGVASLFSPRACSKGIEINVMLHSQIPDLVNGDPARLRHILENLVSNAIKFTDEGEVVISVVPVLESDNKVFVLFKVTDTGIGIPEDEQDKLFEPFTQVDASTTRKYGGTGLGLAICDNLIRMMSGEFSVESKVGQGSSFMFTIPFEIARNSGEDNAVSQERLQGLDVLVVDNGTTSREIIRYYLQNAGCKVSEAKSAEQAVEILRTRAVAKSAIKVALLNYRMPGKNGLELAKEIKADEQIRDIEIVLLSPFDGPQNLEALRSEGISNILLKPVNKNNLINCLFTIMGTPNDLYINTKKGFVTEINTGDSSKIGNIRILLVEDNMTNQKLVLSILKTVGFSCDTAVNGLKALEALENNSYDIILMDCQMPEMDGYEATRKIRSMEDGHRHTPIIAMTANAMKSDYDLCINSGMDDYICKPFKANDLVKMVIKWSEYKPAVNEEAQVYNPQNISDNIPAIFEKLARDLMSDIDFVYDVYNEFVESLSDSFDKIDTAIATSDFNTITITAHTLKGASGSLRLLELSKLASQLELYGRQENIELCIDEFEKVKDYCSKLKKMG